MLNSSSNAPIDNAAQPVTDAPAAEPTQPAEASQPAVKAKKSPGGIFNPETRFGRFMRSLIRTLAIVVVSFALGVLATYLLLYKPLEEQFASQKAELTQARQQIAQQQQDLDLAKQDLARQNTTNQTLTQRINQDSDLIVLYSIHADVNLARYQLLAGGAASSKAALAGIPSRLDQLHSSDSAQIQDVRTRLNLVLSEIDRDRTTAQSDLGILAAQLDGMEKAVASQ